jgi:hypothetical protein
VTNFFLAEFEILNYTTISIILHRTKEETSMSKWIGLIIIIIGVFFGYYLVKDINQHKEITEDHTLAIGKEQWHHFFSPKGDFHVMLPTLPHQATEMKEDKEEKEKKEYTLFVSSKKDGTLFSIYLISFPEKKIENKKDFLMGFIKEMLSSNPKNAIKDLKAAPYRGLDTVDFNVQNEDTMTDGKAFIKNNTVYVLSTTANNKNRHQDEVDYFINSFNLSNTK